MSRRTVWIILFLLAGAVGLVVVCVLAAKTLTSGPLAPTIAQFLGFTGGGEYEEVVETLRESTLDPALRRQGWRDREPADWGDPLPLSSLSGGYRLTLGVPEILGQPRQAFERALLTKEDNLWRVVDHSGDLDGYLEITTGTQALEFVRLLSSPQTFHLWKDLKFVELSVQEFRPMEKPGDGGGKEESLANAPGPNSTGEFLPGALTAEQAKALDFHPPEVRADKEGFLVTRFVAKREPGGSQVYRIMERVSPSGGYEILSAIQIDSDRTVWVPRID
jgi:hypothetical protein